jgi:hypothetical protein
MPAENSVDQAIRLADKKVESVAGHLATFCEMLQSVVCSQDLSEQIVGCLQLRKSSMQCRRQVTDLMSRVRTVLLKRMVFPIYKKNQGPH